MFPQGCHYSRLVTVFEQSTGSCESSKRTQLAEVLHIRLDDVAVELFAVLDGEEYGVEFSDGTCVCECVRSVARWTIGSAHQDCWA